MLAIDGLYEALKAAIARDDTEEIAVLETLIEAREGAD